MLYFADENIELYQGDFLSEDLKKWEGKVDCVITSPPYNLRINYDIYNDDIDWDDYIQFTQNWITKVKKLLNPENGRFILNIPFTNVINQRNQYFDMVKICYDLGFKHKTLIHWDKSEATQFHHSGVPGSAHIFSVVEAIEVMYLGEWKRGKMNEFNKKDITKFRISLWKVNYSDLKEHPSKFPLEIPLRLMILYTFPGDVILDPFVGVGTTILAGLKLNKGRFIIGVELSPQYCEIAVRKIKNFKSQLNLL